MQNDIRSVDSRIADGLKRMQEARTAFQTTPEERAISAMPVVVHYVARIGETSLAMKDGEYAFTISPELIDHQNPQRTHYCDEVSQNAFAIRDQFLRLTAPGEALDFLSKTGQFSPIHSRLTWNELQRWQRFVYLVQEHSELARAMDAGIQTGEHAEVLKALTGMYESSFFGSLDSLGSTPKPSPGERHTILARRRICSWFRQPAGEASSIEWMSKRHLDDDALIRKLRAGGAMIEYLVPRTDLRPVFLIRPTCTLEAIAATLFADRANGIEYRSCECCHELFLVGKRKNKLYCNQARCKNTAHQRRKRGKQPKGKGNKETANRVSAQPMERK